MAVTGVREPKMADRVPPNAQCCHRHEVPYSGQRTNGGVPRFPLLGGLHLALHDIVVGSASVRSFFIPAEGVGVERLPEEERSETMPLAELMAVRVRDAHEGTRVLEQHIDPNLNNEIGIWHGSVAAAGLELVASAAVNDNPAGELLRTASLRVNFLRPPIAGHDSCYVGTALRVGRNTAGGDAQAISDDGEVAITARGDRVPLNRDFQ
jgi:uncharacterized protein (TIGR00369 family)